MRKSRRYLDVRLRSDKVVEADGQDGLETFGPFPTLEKAIAEFELRRMMKKGDRK